MSRDTFQQIKFFKALSNLVLNTARKGAVTTALRNVFQCLSTVTVKNYFLISNLNLLLSFSLKSLPLDLSLNAVVKSPLPSSL